MARPLEVWITVSKGSANLGETNEVKVTAAFQVPEVEADLGAVVEEKFHELRGALYRALESEPPKDASIETEVQVASAAEDSNLEPPFQEDKHWKPCEAEEPAEAAPEPGPDGSEEPPVTPAQERTVRSLCNSAGIGEPRLQAVLEDGYDSKEVAALTKREAAGLILQLTQMRREHILRDKPEAVSPQREHEIKQEVFSRNGSVF